MRLVFVNLGTDLFLIPKSSCSRLVQQQVDRAQSGRLCKCSASPFNGDAVFLGLHVIGSLICKCFTRSRQRTNASETPSQKSTSTMSSPPRLPVRMIRAPFLEKGLRHCDHPDQTQTPRSSQVHSGPDTRVYRYRRRRRQLRRHRLSERLLYPAL